MMDQIASLTQEGDVSIITLDDGKANVFSGVMSDTINNLLDQVPEDRGSLIITGRPGIFSGGFDLKMIGSGDVVAISAMITRGFKLLARIYNFPRPVVAACSGHAVALGAFLLCCADYRLAIKGPFIVQANETRNNMSVPTPILEISKSRISKRHWWRAILNAEAYPVEKAIEPGYLDEVVEAENLMIRAMEVANDLATLGHPHYKLTKDLDQKETLKKIHDAIEKSSNTL